MTDKIAILLPYKEQYTVTKAGAASIWVKDYLLESKLRSQNIKTRQAQEREKRREREKRQKQIQNLAKISKRRLEKEKEERTISESRITDSIDELQNELTSVSTDLEMQIQKQDTINQKMVDAIRMMAQQNKDYEKQINKLKKTPMGVFMRFGLNRWLDILITGGLSIFYYIPGLIYGLVLIYS